MKVEMKVSFQQTKLNQYHRNELEASLLQAERERERERTDEELSTFLRLIFCINKIDKKRKEKLKFHFQIVLA